MNHQKNRDGMVCCHLASLNHHPRHDEDASAPLIDALVCEVRRPSQPSSKLKCKQEIMWFNHHFNGDSTWFGQILGSSKSKMLENISFLLCFGSKLPHFRTCKSEYGRCKPKNPIVTHGSGFHIGIPHEVSKQNINSIHSSLLINGRRNNMYILKKWQFTNHNG